MSELSVIDQSYEELQREFDALIAQAGSLEEAPAATLFDIAGFPHYEDVISNWYAFFLDGDNEHGLEQLFLHSLLNIINEKDQTEADLDSCKVIREHPTKKGGFIDLVLYEGMEGDKFVNPIIIENKIFAELYNDLTDYYNSVQSVDDRKVAIALTLKPVQVPHKQYLNITHYEWLDEIKSNLGEHLQKAHPKYLMLLQDFIRNIEGLVKSDHMLDSVKFYYENADKLKRLSEVMLNSNRYLYENLAKVFPHDGWEWGRVGSVAVSMKQPKHEVTLYVYYTEVYTEKKYRMEFWIQNNAVKKWIKTPDRSILEKNHGKNLDLKQTKDPKQWACLAHKHYTIDSIHDVEHFPEQILKRLENDWAPFMNDVNKLLS